MDESGPRRIDRLGDADRKAMMAQITTLYNHVEQKSITEHTSKLKADGTTADGHIRLHSSQRPGEISSPA